MSTVGAGLSMKQIVAALCLVALVSGSAEAIDLNAPAEKKVTIRSEILRGRDLIDDLPHSVADAYGYHDAINHVLHTEKEKNTDTDAFYLGAYFSAYGLTDI